MARPKKITVSAINIRVHPHSPELYASLLRDAFRLKRMVHVRGDQYIVMGQFGRHRPNDSRAYEGQLSRFTKIESDLPWFDLDTLDVAVDSLVEKIRIPSNIYPNLVTFLFIFVPEKHLLVFESYSESVSVSPHIIKKYLDSLLSDPGIVSKYGSVKVDIYGDRTRLDVLFEIPVLRRLSIEINLPNSDHWDDDLEAEIEARLAEQNIRSERIDYIAEEGKSIEPNERTRKIAEVALSNGRVVARGKDEHGSAVVRSTADIPVVETQNYDPRRVSVSEAFSKAAHALLQRLTGLTF